MQRNSTRHWKYQSGLNLAGQRGYATDLEGRYGDVAAAWFDRCDTLHLPFVLVSIQTTYATVDYEIRPFTIARPGLDLLTPATVATIEAQAAPVATRSPNRRAQARIDDDSGAVSGLTIRDAHDLARWLCRQLRDVTRYRADRELFGMPAGADDPLGGDVA